ncbi:hypothetical protein RchiOBHm_Chr5g0044061 [Rosa chinensis]|uniref:Uncharacterized protein n=1 Tax=Rosa chinensis TaxID=74649 RepID=A0A2P6QDH3_ROSCH|nr:hypothetical protein RchiOBHm_Chr5g0044061 [Rosa chinensis]
MICISLNSSSINLGIFTPKFSKVTSPGRATTFSVCCQTPLQINNVKPGGGDVILG